MSVSDQAIVGRSRQILGISDSLRSLSACFRRTGNERVAEELACSADSLEQAAEEIIESYREESMVRLQQGIANGQRFFGSLIAGSLSGDDPIKSLAKSMSHHLDTDLIDAFEAGKV